MGIQWSEERKTALKNLWPTHTGSQIAKILGVSRNAVVGMAHRMKLVSKSPHRSQGGRPKREPEPVLFFRPPPIERPVPTQPWSGPSVPLLDAKADQCRAIVGSTDDFRGLATVCGDKIVEGQSFSFCAYHLSKYTLKPYRRV